LFGPWCKSLGWVPLTRDTLEGYSASNQSVHFDFNLNLHHLTSGSRLNCISNSL